MRPSVGSAFVAPIALAAIAGLPYLIVDPSSFSFGRIGPASVATCGLWVIVAIAALLLGIRSAVGLLVALLLVALLRLGIALDLSASWPGGADQLASLSLARSVSSGGELAVVFRGAVVKAFNPPAYPFVLAPWSLFFGLGRTSVILLNSLIDIAAAFVLARIAFERWGRRAGVIAGLLYLAWPDRILCSLAPSKEGLALLFVCLILFAVHRIRRSPRVVAAGILLGVSAAGVALTQPAWVPFAGLAALLTGRPRTLFPAAVAGILVMLPWWIRNYVALGAFIPFTTGGPFSLFIAATGNFDPLTGYMHAGNEIEAGRLAAADAWAIIQQAPLHFALFRAAEIARSLAFDLEAIGILWFGAGSGNLHHWALACQLFYAAVASCAVAGMRGFSTRMLLAVLVPIAVVGPWVEFDMRHKELLIPVLIASTARLGGTLTRSEAKRHP